MNTRGGSSARLTPGTCRQSRQATRAETPTTTQSSGDRDRRKHMRHELERWLRPDPNHPSFAKTPYPLRVQLSLRPSPLPDQLEQQIILPSRSSYVVSADPTPSLLLGQLAMQYRPYLDNLDRVQGGGPVSHSQPIFVSRWRDLVRYHSTHLSAWIRVASATCRWPKQPEPRSNTPTTILDSPPDRVTTRPCPRERQEHDASGHSAGAFFLYASLLSA